MGATEHGFYEIAVARDIQLERQVCVEGLSSRGHLDPDLAKIASSDSLRQLQGIFSELGGDTALLAAKRAVPLRLDFHSPDLNVFIEVDETQHFTSERRHSFTSYGGEMHAERIAEYLRLIDAWCQKADRYRAAKATVDFPLPGGRRAQRAYLDAVRDLGASELGIRLVRVPAPECDAALAFGRFESLSVSLSPSRQEDSTAAPRQETLC